MGDGNARLHSLFMVLPDAAVMFFSFSRHKSRGNCSPLIDHVISLGLLSLIDEAISPEASFRSLLALKVIDFMKQKNFSKLFNLVMLGPFCQNHPEFIAP